MWRSALRLTTSLLLLIFLGSPALAAVCQANCVEAMAHGATAPERASADSEDCHHAVSADVMRLTSGTSCGTLMILGAPMTVTTAAAPFSDRGARFDLAAGDARGACAFVPANPSRLRTMRGASPPSPSARPLSVLRI